MATNNVKGTHDVIGEEANAYSMVESLMSSIASLYAYREVRPPVLEHTEVFVRSVGESSDIVRKEMYTFEKADRSLTLRPEFTAGIMRLTVQNKLYATNELPLKLYYCGPVFRYERPQLGRYRQFNQFGVESIGHDSPYNDVEVIALAYSILQSLGLENVTIKINTLGDDETRDNYRKALRNYFEPHIKNMCEDCQSRFELNPLRILDCKVESDHPYIEKAPKVSDFLSENSRARFDEVLASLDELNIPYEIDESLVRGLDYYSETVFEFHYQSQNGNNYGAIGAGGHYGKLMEDLGGPKLPGIGFSFGVERIVSVLKDDNLLKGVENSLDFYAMPLGKENRKYLLGVACMLRSSGYSVDYCFDDTKMGNMFKRATTKKAKYALIAGENEVNNNAVIIKDLEKQEQFTVSLDELIDKVDMLYGEVDEKECCHKNDGEGCCHGEGHHHEDEEHHEGCCHGQGHGHCHKKEEE